MPIEELVAAVTPPKKPLDNLGEWESATALVEIDFPPDFQELISRYGGGEFFNGFLRVYNPLTLAGLASMKRDLDRYRIAREERKALHFDVHP
jgi:hypothetical protein